MEITEKPELSDIKSNLTGTQVDTVFNFFEFVKYRYYSDPSAVESIKDNQTERFHKDIDFIQEFKEVLDIIWNERTKFVLVESHDWYSSSKTQKFAEFSESYFKAKNYVGTIRFRGKNNEYTVNFLPKLFYIQGHTMEAKKAHALEKGTPAIFAHILWWLLGSEKQKYPALRNNLSAIGSDFLEIMMYIHSINALEVFSSNAYHYYQNVEEEIETIRGQISFDQYINNYTRGNPHKVPCSFDALQYDNQFNRIVKYVASLLKNITKEEATKRNLNDLLFILDEVEDIVVTAEDCDKVVLNPIYTELKTVLDSCRLFLSSLSAYKSDDYFSVFALLIPAEKLFENFIYSVLKSCKPDIKSAIEIARQKSGGRSKLARLKGATTFDYFQMLSDIVIKKKSGENYIIDTKYKIINNDSETEEEKIVISSGKSGYKISRSDINQMLAYSVGTGIKKIGLWYPATIKDLEYEEHPVYEIVEELSNDFLKANKIAPITNANGDRAESVIEIKTEKISVIHKDKLNFSLDSGLEAFRETEINLKKQLIAIVDNWD